MTRDELIAALEAATGPSRELDAHIHAARFPELQSPPWVNRGGVWVDTSSEDPNMAFPAQYTSSIDAAMSLVPDGWDWCVACISGNWDAQVGEADTFMAEGAGSKASAAIALCIAALKARS